MAFGIFSKLFGAASSTTQTFTAQDVQNNIAQLSAAINSPQNLNPKLRLYIDRGGGRGQQASGVTLLNRILSPVNAQPVPGLGYTPGANKEIEIVYDDALAKTVVNIRELLGWPANQNQGLYQGVQVTLIPWSNRGQLTPVSFAFSGASDSGKENGNLYVNELNAEYYLRLQPFLYGAANQLQIAGSNTVIELNEVPQLGGQAFAQRGVFIPIPNQINWQTYAGQPYVDVLQALVTGDAQYDILFTYGIHTTTTEGGTAETNAIGTYPLDQATETVLGVMATQRSPQGQVGTGRPSVIVNLDSFDVAPPMRNPFDLITEYLQGHGTLFERQTLGFDPLNPPNPMPALSEFRRNMIETYFVRRRYLQDVNAAPRARFELLPTLQQTQAAVQWLLANDAVPSREKVLWIQLRPPFAQDLFNALLGKSSLPAIFEGNNTANVAVNYSSMYYHIARPGDNRILYPTRVLAQNPGGTILQNLQDAANSVGVPLTSWPRAYTVASLPPQVFAKPINDSRAQPDSSDPYRKYFRSIPPVYRDPANDRFSLGFAYLFQMWGAQLQRQLALHGAHRLALRNGGRLAPLGDGEDRLTQLFEALKENFNEDDKTLKLIPGALLQPPIQNTRILTYLNSFLKSAGVDGLTLAQASIVPAPDEANLEKITVTGTSDVFGATSSVTLVFSYGAEFDLPLQCEMTIVLTSLKISAPNVDWIVLKNPGVSLTIVDSTSLSGGGAQATIALGSSNSVDVSFRYPTPSGTWLFRADTTQLPSVTEFFQLAGGVNLVAIMPSPLSDLANVGLQSLEFVYDSDAQAAQSIAFLLALRNKEPVHLIGPVYLDGINMLVTVSSPGDAKARRYATRVVGTFEIGEGTVTVSAATPQNLFTGELTNGTIQLADLFKKFLPDYMWEPAKPPAITAFSFSYNQPDRALALAVGMDLELTFDAPTGPVTIERVGLNITRSGEAGTTGKLTGDLLLLPKTAKIGLRLSAAYLRDADTKKTGWEFAALQTSGAVDVGEIVKEYFGFDITDQNLKIDGLGATVNTLDGSWEFTAKTAEAWNVPFIHLDVNANFRCGRHPATTDKAVSRYFARVELATEWSGIPITVWYEYDKSLSSFGITWSILEGKMVQQDADTWQASLAFTKDTTLGSIIATMVSWVTGSEFALEAPWSFLNSIPLSGLSLVYTFNTKDSTKNTVAFDVTIGPIEVGFARIDSIRVSYETPKAGGKRKVMIKLVGRFIWNDEKDGGPNQISWDAAEPGAAPAPPGNGSKYLDLRLLALGQHVTIDGLSQVTTVQAAIDKMKKMPPPEPNKLPDVTFDPQSSWLIGMEFGVLRLDDQKKDGKDGTRAGDGAAITPWRAAPLATGGDLSGYMLSMQIVFNDPHLYGLRFALAGAPAKIFAGLDFQIMYRQVSESVGVYQAEITLPDVMRHLTVGAYSITLPVFGIAVYTNGDFQVDIGFPWNQNFSRSFTIEAIIPPGIPVIGSAGFYFGKLSSASTNLVPKATNGTFNPVLVFGFGMQIGFGKSIEYGVLKAGFSVTAVGIIEGVLGKWNPYTPALPGDSSQLQGAYYFWLRGTLGVIGKLYGSVDFAIVKAAVNVEVKLLLQLTYESYVSITITVMAGVSVSVSVEIDFGIFSISVDFSFSMQIKETFTIDNTGDAPWKVAGGTQASSLLRAPADTRLRRRSPEALQAAVTLDWSNLKPDPGKELTGYLAPTLTVARDEWKTTWTTADQVPCYVAMFFIDSVKSASKDRTSSARKAAGTQNDTAFEVLVKMIGRWTVAAGAGKKMSAQEVDDFIADEVLLEDLLTALTVTDPSNPPLSSSTFEQFLNDQFTFKVRSAQECQGKADATVFPMPPSLSLNIPAYGSGYAGYSYDVASYNSVSSDALKYIQQYFNELAVRVQEEDKQQTHDARVMDQQISMAQWVFGDYALLVARQMVQSMRDGVRSFSYPVTSAQSANDVLKFAHDNGSTAYTLADLFIANQGHGLATGVSLTIGVTLPVPQLGSFAKIGIDAGTNGAVLARLNAPTPNLLRTGAIVTYADPVKPTEQRTYTVKAGNDLFAVAAGLNVTLADMLANSTALDQTDLLAANATLTLPAITTTARSAQSLSQIATAVYGSRFDAPTLAKRNAGMAILQAGTQITYPGKPATNVLPNETLGDLAARIGVTLDQLLAQGNIVDNDRLIVPGVTLVPPLFTYQTVKNDTLASVASSFATTPAALGDQAANGTPAGLFLTTDAQGKPWYLDLPHLGRFKVRELLREAQLTLALQHLSGMTSRYYLHGLRLPANQPAGGITPKATGMWVRTDEKTKALVLPDYAGLYALTGAQFPLPDIKKDGADFTMTFAQARGASWLQFISNNKSVPSLTLTVKATSADAESIRQLRTYALGTALDAGLTELGTGSMASSDFANYPFGGSTAWLAGGDVVLPYGPPPSGVPSLTLWALPDAMTALPDRATRAVDPRFSLALAAYDEATGATVNLPVGNYGWASSIPFTIKRVPAVSSSPTTATTYELSGATAAATVLLEHLVAESATAGDALFDRIVLTYAASSNTQALQSAAFGSYTLGIAQVNLSTETRPPEQNVRGALFESATGIGLLNAPSEFVRLLWEASITRSGGFYLYYYDSVSSAGVPDALFDDKGEAQLTLVITYAKPSDSNAQDRLAPYMNAVATSQSLDTTNATLVATAAPIPATVTGAASDSLVSLGYRYYTDVADLGTANETTPLASGAQILVDRGLFQAPPGGIALATIAQRFNTTIDAIQKANGNNVPDPLPYPQAIRIPVQTVTAGSTYPNLGTIGTIFGCSVTELSAANAQTRGLFAGSPVNVPGGPMIRAASVPPGVVSFVASRPKPDDVGKITSPADALNYLRRSYNLLGYRIAKNADFAVSADGLPIGPTTQTDSQSRGKLRAPLQVNAGEPWTYRQAIPYTKPGAPYAATGKLLQVDFDWQDGFGNRIVSTLTNAPAGMKPPYNQPPMLTGYTDALIGLSQWPSVASNWCVDTPSAPALSLDLSFDSSRYRGPIGLQIVDQQTFVVEFTDPVDPTTATNIDNYSLTPKAAVSAATVQNDRFVKLTVALGTGTYQLSVANVVASDTSQKIGLSGSVRFETPGGLLGTSVRDNAARDLRTYSRLLLQMNDPNGLTYAITTSLVVDSQGAPIPQTFDTTQIGRLTGWITGIAGFLNDRANGGITTPFPPASLSFGIAIDSKNLCTDEIYELTCSFSMTRSGAPVIGELESVEGVRSAETTIAPLSDVESTDSSTLGLTTFATRFEAALSVSGRYLLKVATGIDRERVSRARDAGSIWAVRIGTPGGEAISYAIDDSGDPQIFAPRPISNALQSRSNVGLRSYATGRGLSKDVDRYADFANIDMDVWGRQIFAWYDGVLAPQFTAAAQIVDHYKNATYLDDALTYKEQLAASASQWMIAIYKDGTATWDGAAVTEAFRQSLLERLSNAYTTRAGIRFDADVKAEPPASGPVFDSAIVGAAPKTALLRFGAALDSTSAQTAANYSVTGCKVNAASLSSDKTIVTLTLDAPIDPGTRSVTASNIKTVSGESIPSTTRTIDAASSLFGSVLRNPTFLSAAISDQNSTELVLRFGTGLRPSSASNAANYTVKNGPTVLKATLSSDGTTVTLDLSSAPAVDLEVIVQNLTDTLGYPVAPTVVKIGTISASGVPALSTTSARVPLWTQTQAPLAFLVNGSEIVRDDSGAVLSSTSLDLRYDGRSIEHQIAAVAGVQDGYHASSWLQFVVTEAPWPLAETLGAFELPLPLRAFPAVPALIVQDGVKAPGDGLPPVEAQTRWTYGFTYSLPFHYPHDRVHGTVQFNVGVKQMFAGFEDAFAQMAEFIAVFPDVQSDLDAILAGIDATIDPSKPDDAKRLDDAAFALDAFVKMARDLANAAEGPGLVVYSTPPTLTGPEALTFDFYIEESVADYGATKDALVVELAINADGGITDPWVLVEAKGYVAEKRATTQANGQRRIGFVYRKDGTKDQYLPASEGQQIAQRRLELRTLDVLQRQDAFPTIYLERNEELVAGKPSADPFVYRTGTVEFGNPYPPTIGSDDTIWLQDINGPDAQRSLQAHLTALFTELLTNNVEPFLTVKVEATYAYSLFDVGGTAQPVVVPIMLQAPLTIDIGTKAPKPGDPVPSLATMVEKWSEAITGWFEANTPSGAGELRFDLTVLTNLTQTPMPLVELSDLRLSLDAIVPQLAVYSAVQGV